MVTTEAIGLGIGVAGLFFGIYSYFTSGILADKKAGIINTVKIEGLEKRVDKLEKTVEEIEDYYNRGRGRE